MTAPARPSDYDLALRALRNQGVSTEDARAVFRTDPQAVTRLAAVGLEQWAEEETANAEAAWRESDEGRRHAAQQLIARDAEIAERRKEAQAVLRAAGAPDVDLSDEELTRHSGISIPTTEAETKSLNSMVREDPTPTQAEWDENLAAIKRTSKNAGDAA